VPVGNLVTKACIPHFVHAILSVPLTTMVFATLLHQGHLISLSERSLSSVAINSTFSAECREYIRIKARKQAILLINPIKTAILGYCAVYSVVQTTLGSLIYVCMDEEGKIKYI
jgi:hypothetical protein